MTSKAAKKKEIAFTDGFSSFSVDDVKAAKEFYAETLGIDISEDAEGLSFELDSGSSVFLYAKDDHEPATFTVLNFSEDIDEAVDELTERGVEFESYRGEIKTDEKGIFRGADAGHGPNIAWFKDPAGNILSVIEQ